MQLCFYQKLHNVSRNIFLYCRFRKKESISTHYEIQKAIFYPQTNHFFASRHTVIHIRLKIVLKLYFMHIWFNTKSKTGKNTFLVGFACFRPFVRQSDNHVGWATSMPSASIYLNHPRTNPWNIGEKYWELLVMKVFLNWPF